MKAALLLPCLLALFAPGAALAADEATLATSVGASLGESCWAGLAPDQREQRIELLEKALSRAVTQADRCRRAMGFRELDDVSGALARARIRCADLRGVNGERWLPGLGWIVEDALDLKLAPEITLRKSYLDSADVTELASALVHESLHERAARHFRAYSEESERGCHASLFEDRIYLIEAACFPTTDRGRKFYGQQDGASACPQVCGTALASAADRIGRWSTWVYGRSRLHEAYPPDETARICGTVTTVRAASAALRRGFDEASLLQQSLNAAHAPREATELALLIRDLHWHPDREDFRARLESAWAGFERLRLRPGKARDFLPALESLLKGLETLERLPPGILALFEE